MWKTLSWYNGYGMKRFKKVYVEITNRCNLSCSFCPGTKRPGKFLSEEEFKHILSEIKSYTDFVYFHLMGEPLLHPKFFEFVKLANEEGLKVCLTTNGTLLKKYEDEFLSLINCDDHFQSLNGVQIQSLNGVQGLNGVQSLHGVQSLQKPESVKTSASAGFTPLHKISISIQAKEANMNLSENIFEKYFQNVFEFGKLFEGKIIIAYRLWNEGGDNKENDSIIEMMHKYFPGDWVRDHNSFAIGNRVFLELGDKFDWPSPEAELIYDGAAPKYYCYALKDQIGVLSDGTVVPCCLDAEGRLALGNIFDTSLAEILEFPRSKAIFEGFKNHTAAEDLCRRCGFAKRFI